MNNIEVICIPMGETNMHNIVVTIPLPSVDHVGIARKTRSHVWKDRGTHIERENLIEWNIPYLGASDKRQVKSNVFLCDVAAYSYASCLVLPCYV